MPNNQQNTHDKLYKVNVIFDEWICAKDKEEAEKQICDKITFGEIPVDGNALVQVLEAQDDAMPTETKQNWDRTVWDFVSKHYPGYQSCDEIAYNNDLERIVANEEEEDSEARRVLEEDCNGSRKIAQELLHKSNDYILTKAIQGFLNR